MKRLCFAAVVFLLVMPLFAGSESRVSWLSLKMDPESYLGDSNTIVLDSIRIYDEFDKAYISLDDRGSTDVYYFRGKIENDIIYTRFLYSWHFRICFPKEVAQRLFTEMSKKSAYARSDGYEIKNVRCKIERMGYMKAWLIVVDDWGLY